MAIQVPADGSFLGAIREEDRVTQEARLVGDIGDEQAALASAGNRSRQRPEGRCGDFHLSKG